LQAKDRQLRILRENKDETTVPIEDIGFVILDHYGVTISHHALGELLENNVAVITTDETHLPIGMFLHLEGNKEQGGSFRAQLEASTPLKKQLWVGSRTSAVFEQSVSSSRHLKPYVRFSLIRLSDNLLPIAFKVSSHRLQDCRIVLDQGDSASFEMHLLSICRAIHNEFGQDVVLVDRHICPVVGIFSYYFQP